jgi:DNA polymerase III delta subunit
MILIIHGNDITASRNYYFEEKNKLTNPVFINGDGITYDQVFQGLENNTFFEENKELIIENFFGKNKANTNEFKKIVSYLDTNKTSNVIFWENDEISKTALASFKNATVKLFSYPQTMFTFLDNIKPDNSHALIKLFHELLSTMAPELIFFMITRQFRILLNQTDNSKQIDEVKRMAPWQLSKFKKQASYFNGNQLLQTYNKLFEIEISQKTGKAVGSMEKSIDFFLLGL